MAEHVVLRSEPDKENEFFGKIMNFFQDIISFIYDRRENEEKKYTHQFKTYFSHVAITTKLKITILSTNQQFNVNFGVKSVTNEECYFIEDYAILSWKDEEYHALKIIDILNKKQIEFRGKLVAILNKNFILFKCDVYGLMIYDAETQQNSYIKKYCVWNENGFYIFKKIFSLLLEKLIFKNIGEKYSVKLNSPFHGPIRNQRIKVYFSDQVRDMNIDYLYSFQSDYINSQLENGDEIYLPTFNYQKIMEKGFEYIKFLHFIDSHSSIGWLRGIEKYV